MRFSEDFYSKHLLILYAHVHKYLLCFYSYSSVCITLADDPTDSMFFFLKKKVGKPYLGMTLFEFYKLVNVGNSFNLQAKYFSIVTFFFLNLKKHTYVQLH